MSFESEFQSEINEINRKRDGVLQTAVTQLYSDLVDASPFDTGELRRSWQTPRSNGTLSYVISNIAPHAVVIDGGRRQIPSLNGMKWVGSEQLPTGFQPVVDNIGRIIDQELEQI